MHDAMMMQKKTRKHNSNWGNPRDVTIDTTNKGLRPRNPPYAKREGKVVLEVFSVHVDLLDTANKRC